jgi:hypothetical protein
VKAIRKKGGKDKEFERDKEKEERSNFTYYLCSCASRKKILSASMNIFYCWYPEFVQVNDDGYMNRNYVDHPEIEFHCYDATDVASTQTNPSSHRRGDPHFQTYKRSRNERKLGNGS